MFLYNFFNSKLEVVVKLHDDFFYPNTGYPITSEETGDNDGIGVFALIEGADIPIYADEFLVVVEQTMLESDLIPESTMLAIGELMPLEYGDMDEVLVKPINTVMIMMEGDSNFIFMYNQELSDEIKLKCEIEEMTEGKAYIHMIEGPDVE